MAIFCSNCGKKTKKNTTICEECENTILMEELKPVPSNKKGTSSITLGIIGLLFCLSAFSVIAENQTTIRLFYTNFLDRLALGIGFTLIQVSLGVTGLCLACSERKNKKTGINTAGFCLTIITLALAAIQFIVALAM